MATVRRLSSWLLIGLLVAGWPGAVGAVVAPSDGYFERQRVKGFGTLADAAFHERNRALFPSNGFQNQFTGYHAAVDSEYTAPEELTQMVPVRAIDDGTVLYVGDVVGYGGVIVVRHPQHNITSLYGHVRLAGAVSVGQAVRAGQRLADLGSQFSAETSGARKHLHFGIRRGQILDLAGHEPSRQALEQEWLDPNQWLRERGVVLSSPAAVTLRPTISTTPPISPTPDHTGQTDTRNWLEQVWDWLTNLFS